MCVWVCECVCCSQDIKLLSYANKRLFCRLFSSACHTAATSPAQQHPHPQAFLLPPASSLVAVWLFCFHTQVAALAARQTDRQTSRRASDNRHGIWSAANLSQWYADKTNKYQVSLFLFPFRRSVFTLPAALPTQERKSRVWGERGGWDGKKTTLANKFI